MGDAVQDLRHLRIAEAAASALGMPPHVAMTRPGPHGPEYRRI
ncbi:hypothetical protein Strvi_6564 [Streptomyces violaceusniger Tu 4113]|uniref:Uncharacterized protein n=1 Tax=Streptomyces violaceusniger (strain Tu 4113) TaxID=653045 RepID=G2P0G7_STRV4|nr:hypothetical protein Strvi_6564 [Streptomyces violaceusniger Tu 4113]